MSLDVESDLSLTSESGISRTMDALRWSLPSRCAWRWNLRCSLLGLLAQEPAHLGVDLASVPLERDV